MSTEIILNDEVRQAGRTLGWVKELRTESFGIEYENGDVIWYPYSQAPQFEFWDPEACDWTPYDG